MRPFTISASLILSVAIGAALPAAAAPAESSAPASAKAAPASSKTLKAIKDRGVLNCGVSRGIQGFSSVDDKGNWSGFDADFCRAVAAATLGDPNKVAFVPLSATERFEALKARKIDLLSRNSTWSLSNEAGQGVLFAGVTYYDGQGFMVSRGRNLTSALELGGSKVCVKTGTSSETNLADYFDANNMKFELVKFDSMPETFKAYESGKCDVVTSDVSQLHAGRLLLAKPNDSVILAEVISKEPLGPVVRSDDPQWLNIVKWVNFALLDAEELGVSSSTIEEAKQSKKPAVRHFTGAEGDHGKELGLSQDWALVAVKAVGNYGENFERNIGSKSQLGIARGLNHLWNMGGILYAPPIR